MDTLSYHKARPLQSNLDVRKARLKHVMADYSRMKEFLVNTEGTVKINPETEALWFYVQQHAMGLIERKFDAEEPLGDALPFVQRYHETVHMKTLRMFYYILLICTRESRHAGTGTTGLYAKYPDIRDFHKNHVQDSSAESAIQAIIQHAPDVSLGEYVDFLTDAFDMCTYSSGFGGKAWFEVATPLKQFVHGEISAEIMMDTAFTLAHNNGPIFNKGMLYNNYNSQAITMVLDVQRSGQIPQLIANGNQRVDSYIVPALSEYVSEFSKIDSGFCGDVDWSLVKDIHGHRGYKNLIVANANSSIKEKLAAMKQKALDKAAKLKAQAAKAALLKGSFEVMPGLLVPKSKRSQK